LLAQEVLWIGGGIAWISARNCSSSWPTHRRKSLDHPVNQLLFQAMPGLQTIFFVGMCLGGSQCGRMKRGEGFKRTRSWLPEAHCGWNDDRGSSKRATKHGQMPCGNDDMSPPARAIQPFKNTLTGAMGHDPAAVAYEATKEEMTSKWWQQDPYRAGCQRNGGDPGQLLLNEG
jgi:hypothetical protein